MAHFLTHHGMETVFKHNLRHPFSYINRVIPLLYIPLVLKQNNVDNDIQ